ncbi:hypothetical protein EJB05_12523, partial [Eragrostis curvula]
MADDQRAHRAPTSPSPETPPPPPPPPRRPEPPRPHLAGAATRPPLATTSRLLAYPSHHTPTSPEQLRLLLVPTSHLLLADPSGHAPFVGVALAAKTLGGGGLYLKLVGGGLDLRHRLVGGVLFPVRRRRWSSSFLCRGRSLLAPKLVDLAGGGRIQSGADGSMLRRHNEAGSSVTRRRVTGTLKGYDQLLNLVLDEAIEFERGLKIYSKQYLSSTANVFLDEFGMNCEARVIDVLEAMNSHGWLA